MKQMMMKRARTRPTPAIRSKISGAIKPSTPEYSQNETARGNGRINVQNSIDKFTTLAREAMVSGDRVLAESFYQQAEHYLRLNTDNKDNIFVMKGEEPQLSNQNDAKLPVSDFELSIEQELTMALQGQ